MVYHLEKSPLPRSSSNLFLTLLPLLLGSIHQKTDVNNWKLHLFDDSRDREAKGHFEDIAVCVCDLFIEEGIVHIVEWWIHENQPRMVYKEERELERTMASEGYQITCCDERHNSYIYIPVHLYASAICSYFYFSIIPCR